MTDTAQPSGTSSTPDSSGTTTAVAPSSSQAAAPVTPVTAPADAPAPAAAPTETAPAAPVQPDPAAAPAVVPMFKAPDDLKINPAALTKFETTLKAKTQDGKLSLTPQDVVDMFADQARDARALWERQQIEQDKTWETESKSRFSESQLAAAEVGIGFISSFDPQFRDVTRNLANHPAFVNAMRIVGERLSEDSFEITGQTHTETAPRRPADVLYPRKTA